MKDDIKIKKSLIVLMIIGMMIVATFGGIYALSKLNASVTNQIRTPTVDVTVVEEFNEASKVDWFKDVTKKVQFKNTGSVPIFLRVAYGEFWKDENDKIVNSLVASNEVVKKNWTSDWTSLWSDGQDGWYYYRKILMPNETTAAVLTSLTFNQDYVDAYGKSNYTLKFVAEGVQYSDEATVNQAALQANFQHTYLNITNNNVTWK